MNMRHSITATVLVAVFSMVGCGGPSAKFVGTWKQQLPDLTPRMISQGKGKPAVRFTPTKPKITDATLELKSDNTFSMKLDVTSTGTWSYDGIVVVLTTSTVDGKSPAEFAKHPTGEPRDYTKAFGLGVSESLTTLTLPAPSSNGPNSITAIAFEKKS